MKLHHLAFRIGDGTHGSPSCMGGGRGGPWNVASGRFAPTDEEVTCLKCLDHLTRPN